MNPNDSNGTARQGAVAPPKPDAPTVSFVGKEPTEEAVEAAARSMWARNHWPLRENDLAWEDTVGVMREAYTNLAEAALIAAYKVDGGRTEDFFRGPVHGTIQTMRGMCTDELDHMVIDRKLVELDEMVWDFVYPGRVGGVCPDQGGTEVCDDCQPDCPCHGEEA